MSPDFRELVGEEGPPQELERLRRVHELLLAAEPPPELPERLAQPPRPRARVLSLPRPRLQAALGLAAAAAIALAFGLGYVVGDRGGFAEAWTVQMHGVGPAAAASATIEVARRDGSGNWPMLLVVRALPRLPGHGYYELLLTKNGRPRVTCGTFNANGRVTRVQINAPYDFGEYDGWVVTTHVTGRPNQVLLTT